MTHGQMKKALFAQKPVFKRVIDRHGTLSLTAYFKALGASYKPTAVPASRRQELIQLISDYTQNLLGKKAAKAIGAYLKTRYIVSTAAHHDFATHPFFINYILAAGYTNQTVPVLSCAGISLNNSSFPRGLLFHDARHVERRIKVISLKNHHHPVYGHPGYTASNLARAIQGEDKAVAQLASGILTGNGKDLTSQISKAIHKMTKKLPDFAQKEVLYLAQEEVAAQLLLKHHLNKKTIIGKILFNEKIRTAYIKKYNGIIGAHDIQKKTGSILFWGLTESRRVALHIKNGRLVSADTNISIPLTPASLKKALREKTIMPTMGVTLSLLSFYYGLACAGGFSQVNYLSEMKAAYLGLLTTLPDLETEHAIARAVPTDLFAGELVLATLGVKKTPATALDILLDPTRFTEQKLRRLMNTTTLKSATDNMIPELYKIIAHDPASN